VSNNIQDEDRVLGDASLKRCTTVVNTFFCNRASRPFSDAEPIASKHSKQSPAANSSSLCIVHKIYHHGNQKLVQVGFQINKHYIERVVKENERTVKQKKLGMAAM